MKIALAIVCSLFLILGQAVVVCTANASATGAKHDCGCGGKMSCCAAKQASVPQPVAATVPAGSQNQIIFSVPVFVVLDLANTESVSISPTVPASLSANVAPIFARNCAWLI